MSFAKRLKQAMNEKEVSLTELASLIGKGKSSVSQYLSGKSTPKEHVQLQIAQSLDVTVEWLNTEPTDPSEIDVTLKRMSPKDAAKFLGVSPQAVRLALMQNTAPYGYAWRGAGKKNISYHISPKKLKEYIVCEDI